MTILGRTADAAPEGGPDRRRRWTAVRWLRPDAAGRVVAWVIGPLVLWAVLARVLAKGLPPGIVVLGVIYGALYALVAIGIVLVYRANRIDAALVPQTRRSGRHRRLRGLKLVEELDDRAAEGRPADRRDVVARDDAYPRVRDPVGEEQ